MKMILKNHNRKKLNINFLTKKSFFIFLISLLLISIISGIGFFLYLNSSDKDILKENINSYFTLADNYDYFKILIDSLKNNIFTLLIFWILGISVIGCFINLFLYFLEGFSIGFSIASIISSYSYKGIIGSLLYLFPSKVVYLLLIFILTFFSCLFSYKLIKGIFLKEEIVFKEEIKKYYKILLVSFIITIICSLFETFINPLMIKFWTFLNN